MKIKTFFSKRIVFRGALGMERGQKAKAIETARALKAIGKLTMDEIAEATGLIIDDVLRA